MPSLKFTVTGDSTGVKRMLTDLRKELARGIGSIGNIGGLLSGAGLAAAGTKAISDTVEQAKQVAKLAQLANSSIDEASKLVSTAAMFNVTGDKLSDAIRNVSQSASKSPDTFKQIGVALVDVNGKARPTIDIFNDVRRTVAAGANDYRTTAAAAQIFGRSVEDIFPLLRASEAQVQKVTAAAQEMGLVMSKDDVTAALAYSASLQVAQAQGESFVRQLTGRVIPMLGNLAEAAMTAGDMISSLMESGSGNGAQNVLSNLGTLRGVIGKKLQEVGIGPIGALGGVLQIGAPTDDEIRDDPNIKALNDSVNRKAKVRADFEKLAQANALGGGGGSFEFPDLGGGKGRDTVADAMRDRIDAIKDAAAAQEQATRDTLEAFQREKQGAIDLAREETDAHQKTMQAQIDATRIEEEARQKNYRNRIDQIRSAIEEREKQRSRAIAAIRAEMAAEDQAFTAREEARNAEREALNEQLRAMDDAKRTDARATALQQAEDTVAAAKADEPVRVRSESLDEFRQRHEAWVKAVAEAEQRLADLQKSQADEVARAEIEGKLRAIDEASKADRQQADERQKGHADALALIEAESTADREKTDTEIANIEARAAAEREQFDARLAQLDLDAKASQELSDRKIKTMQDELAAHVQQVNDQIEQEKRKTAATVAELEQQLTLHQRNAAAIAAAYPNIERTIHYTVTTDTGVVATTGGGAGGNVRRAASGMDALVGPGAGGPRLILAGEGSTKEEVHIGPVGSGRGGDAGGEFHFYIDSREIYPQISRRAYRGQRMQGGQH